MKPFVFPLQKVLDLRAAQLALEESRVKQQAAALAGLEQQREAAKAAALSAETEVRGSTALAGRDLAALAGFRLRMQSHQKQLAVLIVETGKKLAAQQSVMLEARRRCRLLERLKTRRLADWKSANDKEIDELASESFLAGWSRNSR